MTKVYNDLLLAADVGQVSALCLLDLTAAFVNVGCYSCIISNDSIVGLVYNYRNSLSGNFTGDAKNVLNIEEKCHF